jgi:hypothetical protein
MQIANNSLTLSDVKSMSIDFLFFFIAVSRLESRAMSPAQSEDSGLAADRGSTYATISIPRQNCQSMGIIFAGKIKINAFCVPRRLFTF